MSSYAYRRELMASIGERLNSHVLCYITGDRENVRTRIAPDALEVIHRHLRKLGRASRIDLVLYTRGGDLLTAWRLVHLIREFASHFGVLVPFRSYSAGTLICLGADEIIMGPMGELGPVNPRVVNAFNPPDPDDPAARIPVNVEDVFSYLLLARELAGLQSEEYLGKAFFLLAERIHPLALGNVQRNHVLVRNLARRLLALRQQALDEEASQRIVTNLTEKLYAHDHMIPRREAVEEIGLPITYTSDELDEEMWALYESYADDLELREPFNPLLLYQKDRTTFEVPGGLIESPAGRDAFVFTGTIERRATPAPGCIDVNILSQCWRRLL
ncbi:MAG: SDH family Clp fold serine proteinase [Desulfotomaculales bacterium]